MEEFLFKRLQVILEYCKMKGDLDDFAEAMGEMIIKAKTYLERGNNKKLIEYNNYFDEVIEDDPKADLFLKEKLGINGTTKKRRAKILSEIKKKQRIDTEDEYRIVMAKIDEEANPRALKQKSNTSIIEDLNKLISDYEKNN